MVGRRRRRRPLERLALAEEVLGARSRRRRDRGRGRSSSAEDAALTRFANSEIHQNVAETNVNINLRFVAGRRIAVAASGPDRRGRARPWSAGRPPSPGRRGARGLGRPAGPGRRPRAVAGRARPSHGRSEPGVPGRGRAGRDRRRRCGGRRSRMALSRLPEAIAVANSTESARAGTHDSQLLTVSMSPDGGTGYAEAAATDAATHRCGGDRPRSRPPRRAPPGTPSPSRRATTRSSSRNTRSSTSWTCSATSASRRSPSRRSAPSPNPGGGSGRELVTIVDDGADPAGMPMAFDYEGVPKQRVVLVERGRLPGRRVRRPDGGPGRTPIHRPRAPGPEPLRARSRSTWS